MPHDQGGVGRGDLAWHARVVLSSKISGFTWEKLVSVPSHRIYTHFTHQILCLVCQ